MPRRFVCPDRSTNLTAGKRTADQPHSDDSSSAPKRYCADCLNDNLVDVLKTNTIVNRILTSICNQCGMLWSSIKEDKQAHLDNHIRTTVNEVVSKLQQKTTTGFSGTRAKASMLYMSEIQASTNDKTVSSFRKLSHNKQSHYINQVQAKAEADNMLVQQNSVVCNTVDTRPSIQLTLDGSFLDPQMYTFGSEGTNSYRSTTAFIKDNIVDTASHYVFNTDIMLKTPNWGSDKYLCYFCNEEMVFSIMGSEDPYIKETRVCSCSDYNPEEDTQEDLETAVAGTKEGQTSIPYLSGSLLYDKTSLFKGFVIHTQCCKHYTKTC